MIDKLINHDIDRPWYIYRVNMNEKFKYRNEIKKQKKENLFRAVSIFLVFKRTKNITSRSTDGADKTNTWNMSRVERISEAGLNHFIDCNLNIVLISKELADIFWMGIPLYLQFDENNIKRMPRI